jgi:hypothetical protein
MKAASKQVPVPRYKKIVLHPGTASEILAAAKVSPSELRIGRAAAAKYIEAFKAGRALPRSSRKKKTTPALKSRKTGK